MTEKGETETFVLNRCIFAYPMKPKIKMIIYKHGAYMNSDLGGL
jgi:hypothetical protein